MSFKNWLITEAKLTITANTGLEDVLPEAEKILKNYLGRYEENGPDQIAAINRYQFNLDQYDPNYRRFFYSYVPKEKKRSTEEILSPNDEFYSIYQHREGKTGYRSYKTPKDALENIPANSNYGYRGMSWEEWQKCSKTNQIQSYGSQNFSNQKGLTFYGYTPDTAESYAGSFAPMSFKPTPLKPGVIIAIPRQFLKDHTQNPNIPPGELAHEGPISDKEIAEVYMLIAKRSKKGKFDLSVDWKGRVIEGSRLDLSISYSIRKLK